MCPGVSTAALQQRVPGPSWSHSHVSLSRVPTMKTWSEVANGQPRHGIQQVHVFDHSQPTSTTHVSGTYPDPGDSVVGAAFRGSSLRGWEVHREWSTQCPLLQH